MKVLVLGATGGTGRLIVHDALEKGHSVVAMVRSKASAPDLPGADIIEGDVRDVDALIRALEGCDAVLSSLGTGLSPFNEVSLLTEATHALIPAMKRSGVRRLICISALGVGDSRGHGGFVFDWLFMPLLLRHAYKDKGRQEDAIRASALDWIIVRPAMLTNDPARESLRAIADLAGVNGGKVARANVARFVVEQLANNTWLKKTPVLMW